MCVKYKSIIVLRKRARSSSSDDNSLDEKAPQQDEKAPQPFWPAEETHRLLTGRMQLMWERYPYIPNYPLYSTYRGKMLSYEESLPRDLSETDPYDRPDSWNIRPWSGPPIVWGHGEGYGLPRLNDPPPFIHQCTLARDFIAHWRNPGTDIRSCIGTCAVLVPMVCAYCWSQTWRRCDDTPRVAGDLEHNMQDTHISPVLRRCDNCGLASDYYIQLLVANDDFTTLSSVVSRGEATIQDVLRSVHAVYTWIASMERSPHFRQVTCTEEDVIASEWNIITGVYNALIGAIPVQASGLSTPGIASIIFDYWQGNDYQRVPGKLPRRSGECCHKLLCGGEEVECAWAAWGKVWATELLNSHPFLHERVQENRWGMWIPESWASWSIVRTANRWDESTNGSPITPDQGNTPEYEPGDGD